MKAFQTFENIIADYPDFGWDIDRLESMASEVCWDDYVVNDSYLSEVADWVRDLIGSARSHIQSGDAAKAANCAISATVLIMAIKSKIERPRGSGRPADGAREYVSKAREENPNATASKVYEIASKKYAADHPGQKLPYSKDTVKRHFKKRVA